MKYTKAQAQEYRAADGRYCPATEHFGAEISRLTVHLEPSAEILDLGCGTGRYFHRVKGGSHITAVDVSKEMLFEALKPINGFTVDGIALVRSDINKFEPAEQFDFVYSVGVLAEHIELTRQLLNKIHSWLKPGGRVYLTAERTKKGKPKTVSREKLNGMIHDSKFGAGRIATFKTNTNTFMGEHFEVWLTR